MAAAPAAPTPTSSGAAARGGNPYVGPRPFTSDESGRFFGREAETRILASLVVSRQAVLLFAPSGAGKSSLIRAGLLPKLARVEGPPGRPGAAPTPRMRVLPIASVRGARAGAIAPRNPFVLSLLASLRPEAAREALAASTLVEGLAPLLGPPRRAAAPALVDQPPRVGDPWSDDPPPIGAASSPAAAAPAASDDPPGSPTLLVVDQFEELFTHHVADRAARGGLFLELAEALRAWPELHLLLAMREDYIAELTPYAAVLPDELRSRFRVEGLSHTAALGAVKQPAIAAGIPFADGVAEELVDNLRRERGERGAGAAAGDPAAVPFSLGERVEPVHLQIVCRRLWAGLPPGRTRIETGDVAAFGDVDRALTDFYEGVLAEVLATPELAVVGLRERSLREWFGPPLITPARTRGLVYRGEQESQGLDNRAVDRLAAQYLIRAEVRGGETWYELSHDRLVEPLLRSNARWREANLRPLTVDAEGWAAASRDPQRLYDGRRLAEARRELRATPERFAALEESFVVAGEAAADERGRAAAARLRRQRWLVAGLAAVALILSGLTTWALRERGRARAQQARAEAASERATRLLRMAKSQQLAAQALREVDQRADLAALLAIEALRMRAEVIAANAAERLAANAAERLAANTDERLAGAGSPERAPGRHDRADSEAAASLSALFARTGGRGATILHGSKREIQRLGFDEAGAIVTAYDAFGARFRWRTATGAVASPPQPAPAIPPPGRLVMLALAAAPEAAPRAAYVIDRGGDTASRFDLFLAAAGDALPAERATTLPANPSAIAFCDRGTALAIADAGGVRSWSLASPPQRVVWIGDAAAIACDSAGRIAIADRDGPVRWYAPRGRPLRLPDLDDASGATVARLAFSDDGALLAAGGDRAGILLLWAFDGGRAPETALPLRVDDLPDRWRRLAFSRDGERLAAGGDRGTVALFDTEQERRDGAVLTVHPRELSALGFSDDRRWLASADVDGTVVLWDLAANFAADAARDDPASLRRACQLANRNLTAAEWQTIVGDEWPYHCTCPSLPSGDGAPACDAAP